MRTSIPRWTPISLASVLAAALALLAAAPAGAQPPPGYYDTVDASHGAVLRTTLHEVIDDHIRFPYTSASTDTWDILELADEDPGNPANILDVYLNASFAKEGGGNDNYTREHTWPNSRLASSSGSSREHRRGRGGVALSTRTYRNLSPDSPRTVVSA